MFVLVIAEHRKTSVIKYPMLNNF